jgi:hypothetical protein
MLLSRTIHLTGICWHIGIAIDWQFPSIAEMFTAAGADHAYKQTTPLDSLRADVCK